MLPELPGLFKELVLFNSTSQTYIVLSQAAQLTNLSPFGDQAMLITGLWFGLFKNSALLIDGLETFN